MSSPPNVFLFTLMGDMHTKFGGDWTHSSGDMLADRQTDRQTDTADRHAHHKISFPTGAV